MKLFRLLKYMILALLLHSCAGSPLISSQLPVAEPKIKNVIIITVCEYPIFIAINMTKGKPIISDLDPLDENDTAYFMAIVSSLDPDAIAVVPIDKSFNFTNGLFCL